MRRGRPARVSSDAVISAAVGLSSGASSRVAPASSLRVEHPRQRDALQRQDEHGDREQLPVAGRARRSRRPCTPAPHPGPPGAGSTPAATAARPAAPPSAADTPAHSPTVCAYRVVDTCVVSSPSQASRYEAVTARNASTNDPASSSGTRNSRSLAMKTSPSTEHTAQQTQLHGERQHADDQRGRGRMGRHPPRHEQVADQAEQRSQPDPRPELQPGQVAGRALQHHGLVDHGQLQVGGWVVHREAARSRRSPR